MEDLTQPSPEWMAYEALKSALSDWVRANPEPILWRPATGPGRMPSDIAAGLGDAAGLDAQAAEAKRAHRAWRQARQAERERLGLDS